MDGRYGGCGPVEAPDAALTLAQFASWQLMAGGPAQVVQMRMGHESLATTSTVYAHLLVEEQAGAVGSLGWDPSGSLPHSPELLEIEA